MAGLFLGKDPNDETVAWKEWQLQAYVIQEARRIGLLIAGDMNQGKRNPGRAKATGLLAGETDLRIYLTDKQIELIELKTKTGKLSPAQHNHHGSLRARGFEPKTVYGSCPADAWYQVQRILNGRS